MAMLIWKTRAMTQTASLISVRAITAKTKKTNSQRATGPVRNGKMTCPQHDVLLQQLKEAEEEIERLKDENEALWFMLEEMKDADKAMMDNLSEIILEGLTPTAEA